MEGILTVGGGREEVKRRGEKKTEPSPRGEEKASLGDRRQSRASPIGDPRVICTLASVEE